VNPEVAIVLEVDIAGDVPGIDRREALAKMGKGPSVLTFDRSLIPNEGLLELVIDVAKKKSIKYQLSGCIGGGTDGGMIHLTRSGCPTVVISVPTRHIHSHVGMASVSDIEACVELVTEVVKRLDAKTVASFTAV
jgi:endoglucanase